MKIPHRQEVDNRGAVVIEDVDRHEVSDTILYFPTTTDPIPLDITFATSRRAHTSKLAQEGDWPQSLGQRERRNRALFPRRWHVSPGVHGIGKRLYWIGLS